MRGLSAPKLRKSRGKSLLAAALSLALLNSGLFAPLPAVLPSSLKSPQTLAQLFAQGPLYAASALLGALLSPPDASAQTFEIMNKLLVDGSSTFKGATLFVATSAPTAYSGNGTLYFDSSKNEFLISQNGSAFEPIALGTNSWLVNGADIYNANAGNVGIGTTNPTSALYVAGDIHATGDITGATINGGAPVLNPMSSTLTLNGSPAIDTTGQPSVEIDTNVFIPGHAAVGASAFISSVSVLNLNETYTGVVNKEEMDGLTGALYYNPGSGGPANGVNVYGGNLSVQVPSGNSQTMTNDSMMGILAGASDNGSGSMTNGSVYGGYFYAYNHGSSHQGFVAGVDGEADNQVSGGLIDEADGGDFSSKNAASVYGIQTWVGGGTIEPETNLYAVDTHVNKTATSAGQAAGGFFNVGNTGVVTSGTDSTYGLTMDVTRTGAAGGTINVYGVNVGMSLDGGDTNAYGIYLGNIAGAVNNYAIYSAGGKSYFAGNVGVGTATPNYRLDIYGDVHSTGTFYGNGSGLTNLPGGASQWSYSSPNLYETGDNVGIGTTSPQTSLEISTNEATGYMGVGLRINAVGGSTGNGAAILWTNNGDVLNLAEISGIDAGNWGGDLVFLTAPGTGSSPGGTPTERMRIDSTGNVGIGTTNPGQLLNLYAAQPALEFSNTGYPTTYNSYFGELSGAIGVLQLGNNGTNYIVGGNTVAGGQLDFIVNNTNAFPSTPNGTQAMTILSSGNVGIGTTIPAQKLEVNGNIRATSGEVESTMPAGNANGGLTVYGAGNLGYNIATAGGPSGAGNSWSWNMVDGSALSPGTTYFSVGYPTGDAWTKGNMTVSGTTFFGTGSTYQVTSGGAATLAGDVCATAAGGLVPCNGNNHGTIGTSAPDAWASVYAYDIYGNMHPGAPDLAERYPGDVAPGDVVVLSREPQKNATVLDQSRTGPHDSPAGENIPVAVEKSNQPYQSDIFGVVSTAPGIELSDPKDESNPPIALTGRVPVKVDLEGGPIKIGDYLTSSSRPGYAMKATGPGATVGIALENFGTDDSQHSGLSTQDSVGRILCFVHVGGNQEAYVKDIDDLQKQNASLRGNLESLKSLVCADHPGAAACR